MCRDVFRFKYPPAVTVSASCRASITFSPLGRIRRHVIRRSPTLPALRSPSSITGVRSFFPHAPWSFGCDVTPRARPWTTCTNGAESINRHGCSRSEHARRAPLNRVLRASYGSRAPTGGEPLNDARSPSCTPITACCCSRVGTTGDPRPPHPTARPPRHPTSRHPGSTGGAPDLHPSRMLPPPDDMRGAAGGAGEGAAGRQPRPDG